jgi:hypothetical protein
MTAKMRRGSWVVACLIVLLHFGGTARGDARVVLMRVPDGGVQPQAAVDEKGVVHLIYLHGDPQRSDVFYVRSTDGGSAFGKPLRVNSQPGSAIAMGTVRGAHLAIGRGGRVHVAWMGSGTALPKGPGESAPMLYSRLKNDGSGFEPQRNVIQSKPGLDGGGSIAADRAGNVFIAWHAPQQKGAGEQSRRVWVVRSTDDGKTFSAESAAGADDTGACGCCGMRLLAANDGKLYALYRSADRVVHRDMILLDIGHDASATTSRLIAPMNASTCIMSTAALAASGQHVLGAWETNGKISWATLDQATIQPIRVPGNGRNEKHPALAVNAAGDALVAWTQETGWNKGGTLAWQLYDATGTAKGPMGAAPALPVWGSPAAFVRADGTFVILF